MINFTKTVICLFTCIGIIISGAMAQGDGTTIVKGKVTDRKTKEILIGVSVMEIDAEGRIIKGTTSDIEGNYILKVTNLKNRISASFIGYKTIVSNINGKTLINIPLEGGSTDLNEFTVMAKSTASNGMSRFDERKTTTAIAKINAAEMEEMASTSIDQALQGRLSGVDITATSGDPGAAMNIRIRGISSISGSGNPLIVVDGMPIQTEIPGDFNFGSADEQGYAQLLNISPADIREITALKDASATAIWGSRAANGVLVITTKRGGKGAPAITYTAKTTASVMPKAIPLLNGDQYSTLIPEAFINRNGSALNTTNVREFNYDPNDPYWYNNYSNNTNWVEEVTQTGIMHDHNLSMTGGGDKARYFASVGYNNQTGTAIGTGLKRISSRINLDYFISSRIKIFTSIAYTHSDQDRNYMSSKEGAIRAVAYTKMPNMSVFEYDEQGNISPTYFSPAFNVQGQYSRIYNPVAMAREAKYSVLGERVIPRFQIDYSIVPDVLRAMFDVQFDINNTKNKSFLPQIATGRPNTETVVNRAYDGDIDVFGVNTKFTLEYLPRFKNPKHVFGALFIVNTEDVKAVNQEIMTSNTASSLLQDPSIPSRTQNQELMVYSGISQTRNVGATLSAKYEYNDKYFIEALLRGDGSSRFGPNYRYGLFPSVGVRWRVSGEKFFSRFKNMEDLSFRASYGQSGDAPDRDYTFFNRYNTYSWSYQGQNGVYPATMGLSNLRWQTNHGTNIGFNVSFFSGRLRADGNIYRNRTKDMFLKDLRLGSHTGYSSTSMNIGTLDNQGWEFALFTTPLKKKNYTLQFDLNIAANENIIREISEFYPSSRGDVTVLGQYMALLQVNNPFGSFYGYRYKGVYKDKEATIAKGSNGKPITNPNGQNVYMRFNYPSIDYTFQPGDAIYEDINNDGNINYMDVVYLGNSNPKLMGGFGPKFIWKGKIQISAYFNFRLGYDIVNGAKMNTSNMYYFDNQSTATLRRWRKEGDVTDIPRAVIGGGYNWLGSDRYVEDASFLRFRTITARYMVDQKTLKKLKMKKLDFYVTAEGLYTFTKYTGQDPEVTSIGSDPFRVAFDYSMTPPSRAFTLGIVAGF